MSKIKLYFSDYFKVSKESIDDYGAFNISLVSDLPLFIDPFLLFNSKRDEYRNLHERIIRYLRFLKDKSSSSTKIEDSVIKALYQFSEIKETWLGFSESGNKGLGLGLDFGKSLYKNLNAIFSEFGNENVTKGSHLEKLCLIERGVGKDKISDFTTNLIKDFLLDYTEKFTLKYINKSFRKKFFIKRIKFNYNTETFENGQFELPNFRSSYIVLIPKDILTKDDTWINKSDLINDFDYYTQPTSMPNDVLRNRINNYFLKQLPKNPNQQDRVNAIFETIKQFNELIDYYIKFKEDNGRKAEESSNKRVIFSNNLYVENFGKFIELLSKESRFYLIRVDTYKEAIERCKYLKDVIENKGGYRYLYLDDVPIKKEEDIHLLYRLTWHGTLCDVSHEVNNGRGSADFKISFGALDKTIVEFKLASNPQLKRNLKKQTSIYKKASDAKKSIEVIIFFSETEERKIYSILGELKILNKENIILIDARNDNKPSASRA
jgi:hypothetical protein